MTKWRSPFSPSRRNCSRCLFLCSKQTLSSQKPPKPSKFYHMVQCSAMSVHCYNVCAEFHQIGGVLGSSNPATDGNHRYGSPIPLESNRDSRCQTTPQFLGTPGKSRLYRQAPAIALFNTTQAAPRPRMPTSLEENPLQSLWTRRKEDKVAVEYRHLS